MSDEDLACRCMGVFEDDQCRRQATQEDGLCDMCRCEHGCCEDHENPIEGYRCGKDRLKEVKF